MVSCPLLSNPDVAREFNELKEATKNERYAYALWSANNGYGLDKAPNGAQSKLFNDLLKYFDGDRIKAMRAKIHTYTKPFKDKYGTAEGEPSVESILEYLKQKSKRVESDANIEHKLDEAKIVQDKESFYRGQYDEPFIDINDNLILRGRRDPLYEKAGYGERKGVSVTRDLQTAVEYGYGQLETRILNVMDATMDETEQNTIIENGFYLIQFKDSIPNEEIKEAGESKIIGDITVPKGSYIIEHYVQGELDEIITSRDDIDSRYSINITRANENIDPEYWMDEAVQREIDNVEQDIEEYAVDKLRSELKDNPNIDILELVQKSKQEWINERQRKILNDTQEYLAKIYGLEKEVDEDGRIRFVSSDNSEKTRLVIDFLDYISDDTEGYYDYNTKSSAAHHVIAISLTEGDPSTFSHELAHYYIRMFYNSKLIQTALRAVDKPGMTDEQREEALVDIITAKVNESPLESLKNPSFLQKFWYSFAAMLYNTFGLENNVIRNALYRNITRAFVVNEQQRKLNSQKITFNLADTRKYKKNYKERLTKARGQARRDKSISEYQRTSFDKVQEAIGSIVQGTISRNKSYRKSATLNQKTLVNMQIAEDTVKKFAQDIKEFRENFISSKNPSGKRVSPKLKVQSAYTQEEINANVGLIRSFIQQAKEDLFDVSEKFKSMESTQYSQLISIEINDPNSNSSATQYLDKSHVNDENVTVTEVDFAELNNIGQNTIGFYKRTIGQLLNAVKTPEFKNIYGEDIQAELLNELSDSYSQGSQNIRLSGLINNLDMQYEYAITKRLRMFVKDYINKNTELPQDKKDRLINTTYQWLENQFAFGDIGAMEVWLGLASNSKSSLIRLMQDLIDNAEQKKNDAVNKKGFELRQLRKKAIKSIAFKYLFTKGRVYGVLSPFHIDKLLMEYDDSGFTGNMSSKVNKGKFYNDRMQFINSLLFSKNGIESKLKNRLGSDFELEISADGDPIFPDGQDDLEKQYLHALNEWMSHHAVRRFTKEYYAKRIDMLSTAARKAVTSVQNDINKIIEACTIDGKVHTELLTKPQMNNLHRLYYKKSQLSNIFDEYGREKPVGSIERQIADELSAWNEFQSSVIKNKIDYEAFEEAKKNAKNKEAFDRENTYLTVNPELWDEVARIFPKSSDEDIQRLRKIRNKLTSIIKQRGISNPKLDQVVNMETGEIRPGYEEFWKNLRAYDELIETLKNQNKSVSADAVKKYHTLMGKASIMIDLQNGTQETVYTHLQKAIKRRLVQKYGDEYDPRVSQEFDKEIQNFEYRARNKNGQLVKAGPLSIFSITKPLAKQVTVGGKLIDSTVMEPIQAYSVIDVENSDKTYVDDRFDVKSKEAVQPITDGTVRSSDDVSYTNKDYIELIENGTEEMRAYYNALKSTMEEAYKNIPFAGNYDGRLPQKGATTRQMFHRKDCWNIIELRNIRKPWKLLKPWKVFKPFVYWFKRAFTVNESDVDINIDYELRPDGSRSMNIPIRFIRRLDNPNEINSDVLGTVIEFYEMSVNYKNKSEVLPVFLTAVEKLGRQNVVRNRQKKFLQGVVNRQFYDRVKTFDTDEDNLYTYTSTLSRLALKLIPGFKALTQTGLLALNWLAGLVAWIDPTLQLLADAISGRYIDLDDYIRGTGRMIGSGFLAPLSIGKSKSYDFVSAGLTKFGMAKTGYLNFKDMDKSQITRFLSDGLTMLPFSLGERTINAQVFGTTFESYKYIEDAGKFMNKQQFYEYAQSKGISIKDAKIKFKTSPTLFSAYEVSKNGEFVRKDNKYGKAITEEFELQLGKRMRNRATNTNYIVPSTERTKIQSNIFAVFVTVMRTFMLVGLWERFRSFRDFQTDDEIVVEENAKNKITQEYKDYYYADKGGYNFQTGEIEDGVFTALSRILNFMPALSYLWNMIKQRTFVPKMKDSGRGHIKDYVKYGWYTLKHPFRSRYNEKSKQAREEYEISETDIYGFNRVVSELFIFAALAFAQILFHNKMVDDGDDDKYWYQVVDHLLIRSALVRLTWFSPDTFMDLVNSITPSKGDLDKKLKFIDLVQDAYIGFRDHGKNYEDWEKVSSGGYKNDPKAFRDLLQTFSSIGLHNLYTSSSTEGVKTKTKFFKPMVFWRSSWHEAKSGRKSGSENKNTSIINNGGLSGGYSSGSNSNFVWK